MTEDESDELKRRGDEYRLRVQAETTLQVWIRTSLALMGFGFVVARFGLFLREVAQVGHVVVRQHPRLAMTNSVMGTVLILLGVTTLIVAVVSHRRFLRRLEQGRLDFPSSWSAAVILGLVLAAFGMFLAVYLAAVAF